MTLRQSHLTSAFILHTRPYRETSLLADFFTEEFGRLSAIIRGVRKARSSYAGLLLPFLPLCVSFRGKTDLLNISTLEATGTYYLLQNRALFYGLYANELLYRLLHKHDPYPVLYSRYQGLLINLQNFSTNSRQQQWALYLFTKELLQEIGYGVQWNETTAGEPIDEHACYCFEFGLGFNIAKQQQGTGIEQNRYVKGSSLLALHNGVFCGEDEVPTANEFKKIGHIFNGIFHHLLGDKFSLCQRVFAASF